MPSIQLNVDSSYFNAHAPKPDQIVAVKLDEDNLKRVGSSILDQIGGKVEVDEEECVIYIGGVEPVTLAVGNWVVRDYDYATEEFTYRVATLDERKKYDLR